MTTNDINNTINANKHNPDVVTDNISDGYHTFGQLYYQRMMLFATLVNLFPEISWKTTRHEDGEECFGGGWFLVTIDTPAGAYGYHYEMKDWNRFHCQELERAKPWDGYTEKDVNRLMSLVSWKSLRGFIDKHTDVEVARMFARTNAFSEEEIKALLEKGLPVYVGTEEEK